jgi:carbonic anhydrase
MSKIEQLLQGFERFREDYFEKDTALFRKLATHGQKPSTLLISCSDSRVDPAILFGVAPGELFVVRNVANLVPPYEPDNRLHGTSSAIEFAVRDLKVSQIIILGHSNCGGIHALCNHIRGEVSEREFIARWVSIAAEAVEPYVDQSSHYAEQAAIRASVQNLKTFPWIEERVLAGDLTIHGWWFDLGAGELSDVSEGHGRLNR